MGNVFAERLRAARELRNLSQSGLAENAKLQPSAISHFEIGTRSPSFDNLKRLADALDAALDGAAGAAHRRPRLTAFCHRQKNGLDSFSVANPYLKDDKATLHYVGSTSFGQKRQVAVPMVVSFRAVMGAGSVWICILIIIERAERITR